MYGVDPPVKSRPATGPELRAACPTCKRKEGEACIPATYASFTGDSDKTENTELPHNRRFKAANMEWSPAA